MPIIKSAKKRTRVAKKAAARNRRTKRQLRDALKSFKSKVGSDSQKKAQSAIDQAVKKGLMHKNKAARQKKQLAKQAKTAGVKISKTTKKATAKPAPKKTTAAKKPVAKKATAKKTASKK